MKNRIFWTAGAVTALIICLFICRQISYIFHGNKQWSVVLFIIGFVALCIAAIFDGKKIMTCIVIGYVFGLVLGTLFNSDVVIGPNGETGKNWWHIWTVSFFIMIIMGIIWEITGRIISRRKK